MTPPINPDWIWAREPYSSVQAQETPSHSAQALVSDDFEHDADLEQHFRHSGWAHLRRRVWQAFARTDQSLFRLNAFGSCGSDAVVEQSDDDPDAYRLHCYRCHDRFCLPCARERSHTIARNLADYLQDRPIRFVTLTLRSADEPLKDLLDKLYQSFAKLRRQKIWKTTQHGGAAFCEIKWNPERNRWHPHLHVLTEGKYLNQQALKEAWHRITVDSYVVDIRRPPSNEHVTAYVVKYASKPLDPSFTAVPDRLDEAVLALKGRRLCLTFGTWQALRLTAPIDTGTWTPVASLTDIVRRSRAGDDDARRILRKVLTSTLAPDTQDPPDTS